MKKLLPFLFILLAACGKNAQMDVTDSGIIGGSEVGTSDPILNSTVSIVQINRNLSQTKTHCTGTLISKNLILTAAHCIEEFGQFSEIQMAVSFGKKVPAKIVKIEKQIKHPHYTDLNISPYDIALIKIAEDAPEGYKPIAIADSRSMMDHKSKIILAGFGWTTPTGAVDRGTLKRTEVPFLGYGMNIFEVDQTGGTGACHGDSGGPAFLVYKGLMYLIGSTRSGNKQCMGITTYMNVPAFKLFIKNTALLMKAKPATFINPRLP